jgi:hypothetical protein
MDTLLDSFQADATARNRERSSYERFDAVSLIAVQKILSLGGMGVPWPTGVLIFALVTWRVIVS